MEQIRELIASNGMKPGDKLSSERELVNKLQISRTSVREHRQIMQAIITGEEIKAQKAMTRHLRKGLDKLKKLGLENLYPLDAAN